MRFPNLRSIRDNQKGFTLIEMVVVLAITGLIGAGVAIASVQIINQGTRNNDYTTASRNTMNAIHWISRDAQMAQIIEPNGASGFTPLTLQWVEWDNSSHQVNYSIEDGKLIRSYSGNGSREAVVAEYINSVAENTTCGFTSDNTVMLTVTTTIGTGLNAASVTKIREITPRPGL